MIYCLGKVDAFGRGRATAISVAGVPHAVVHRSRREIILLRLVCSHQQAQLTLPEDANARGSLVCARHGWQFELASGRCTQPPAAPPLAALPVHRVDDELYVDLPAMLPADDGSAP